MPDYRKYARRYDAEFKENAVALVQSGRSVREVAHDLGVSGWTLRAATEAIRVVRQAQKIRQGPPQAVLVPNKLQVQYRLSRELLETAKSLEIPSTDGLRLRQAYADAAGQGTVVWRLGPRGVSATHEIRSLFDGLLG